MFTSINKVSWMCIFPGNLNCLSSTALKFSGVNKHTDFKDSYDSISQLYIKAFASFKE